MIYRFRVSRKPRNAQASSHLPARRRRLRLKGGNTLRGRPPLPDPIEEISFFEFGEQEEPRRRRTPHIRPFFRRLWIGLSTGTNKIFQGLKRAVSRLRPKKKKGSLRTLPILSGVLCAALLVSAFSAAAVLFGLFHSYGQAYERVVIPDFVGKDPEQTLYDKDRFNLILQYEANEAVAPGLVIAQAPRAGVSRRITAADQRYTVVLTVSRPREPYRLENLIGRQRRDAILALRNAGMQVSIAEEYSDSAPKGTVLLSLPASGTLLSEGSTVVLRVSLGKEIHYATVPNLNGLSEAAAGALLRNAGLRVGEVSYQTSPHPAGSVIEQSIAPYSTLEQGSSVSYTVSAGDRYRVPSVPDLYGMTLREAEKKLKEYGLTLGSAYSVAGSEPQGTVVTQSPLAGTPITSATVSVDVYVSS